MTVTPRSLRLLGRLSARVDPYARTIAANGALCLALALAVPDSRPVALAVVVLMVGLSVAIIPHELAHAAAARAGGLAVRRLALGFGPVVAARTVRTVAFELRLIPVGGYAEIPELASARPLCRSLIALMGPAVNLLLAALFFVAATTAAGAPTVERAATAATEIGALLMTGTGEAISTYLRDPGNLARFPIAGLPATALAAAGAISGGYPMLLILAGALSLSTGIVNLLPYPPLDGSIVLSAFTGRRFGRRSALAVDALLVVVLLVNLIDAARVAQLLAG